ncbi:hypothetical protein B0H16DRAFT_1481709 [Mycena metata]|uniref:Uncharacterized protein n=1 Tax=Mycena metata TaxID=1033252 RepID=A0AAD7GX91_9AGAR|nr:hypothetical protein B0H16DRAFT_1481709 [Mycena metata]
MFPRDELHRFCLFMLEDQKADNTCLYCIRDGLDCMPYSWGRHCHWCERRQIDDCLHAKEPSFQIFVQSFPFGRDKFTLDQLLPAVPACFEHLRRCHFNVTSNQIKGKIDSMTNIPALVSLAVEFQALKYDPRVFRWVTDRLSVIHPNAAPGTPETTVIYPFTKSSGPSQVMPGVSVGS